MSTTILSTPTSVTVGAATLVGRIWRVAPLMPWSGDTSAEANTYRTRNAGKTRDVRTWLGVRYARPPVGPLRWKEARDYNYPAGTYQCDRLGSVPHQTYGAEGQGDGRPEWGVGNGAADWATMVPGGTQESEDCLVLHIWAPPAGTPPSGGYPVVFWMHGGGFSVNAAAAYHHRGHRLATKGCIVVAVEYRMSNFGYYFHPGFESESDWNGPNFMLSDVKSALRWVNRNITAFGGNPAKVMIGGTSAGAVMSLALMEDPTLPFACSWVSSGGGTGARRYRNDSARSTGYSRRYLPYNTAARAAATNLRDYSEPRRTIAQSPYPEADALRRGLSPSHVMAFSDGRRRIWRGRVNPDGSKQGLIGGQAIYAAYSGTVNDDPPYIGNGVAYSSAVAAAASGRFTRPAVLLASENETTLNGSYSGWSEETATEWLRLIDAPDFWQWSQQPWTTAWGAAEKRRRIYVHAIFAYAAWKMSREMVRTSSAPAWLCLWAFSTAGTAGHSSDVHFEFGNVEWNAGMSGSEAMVTARSLLMAEGMMQLMANMANSGNPNTAYTSSHDFNLFATKPGFSLTASSAGGTYGHWNILGRAANGAPAEVATAPVQAVYQSYLPDAWTYYDTYYSDARPQTPQTSGWDDNTVWAD